MSTYELVKDGHVIHVDLDKHNQQQLVAHANKLVRISEVAQVAMDETSKVFVMSDHLVAKTLVATQALEEKLTSASVSPENYPAYYRLQTNHYMQRMAKISQEAADAIAKQAVHSY